MDVQQRVASLVARSVETGHKPEGVSVMVRWLGAVEPTPSFLRMVAIDLSIRQYPSAKLTGEVLYLGLDEFGTGVHEVVLEVA